jgi:acetate kinase
MIALTVNTGSTSVRLALWEGAGRAALSRTDGVRWDLPQDADARLHELAKGRVPEAIVHRVVHGGTRSESVAIDATVLAEVRALVPLAPNHNPRAVEWIEACAGVWPGARQIAAFDTAFFARLPLVAQTYALPRDLVKKHALRRYGFHGLAHASMWHAWCAKTKRNDARVITLQLGGGCSAAAIVGGAPLETSMGLTPLEGLVMATRAGDVDPGLLVHLQRTEGLAPDALESMLAKKSGLLGVSGRSGDLRELAKTPDDPDVRLALDVFVHRVRKYMGAYAAVLGGLDGVVMGGGVSEHWPDLRARILSGFEWLGLSVDADANANAKAITAPVHAKDSRVEVWVAAIDEERELLEAL